MKKLARVLSALLILTVMAMPAQAASLIGTWYASAMRNEDVTFKPNAYGMQLQAVFKKNGTCVLTVVQNGETDKASHTWTLSGANGSLDDGTNFVYSGSQLTMFLGGVEAYMSRTKPAALSQNSIANAAVSVSDAIYTGKPIKPQVHVVIDEDELVAGTDYTVTYRKNTAVGHAAVVVKGKGNYTGQVTGYFDIYPKAVRIKRLTGSKKALTVKWTGPNKQVTGYEVEYSTVKSFKNAKYLVVPKATSLTGTVNKLTSGKKYYVRVRAYRKVGGLTYYSEWSPAKRVAVK